MVFLEKAWTRKMGDWLVVFVVISRWELKYMPPKILAINIVIILDINGSIPKQGT